MGVRVLAEGRYLTLVDDEGWEYVTRPTIAGIVVIVAITNPGGTNPGGTNPGGTNSGGTNSGGAEPGKLVLVEQYRRAVQRRVIELPAGLVGDVAERRTEGLAEAAARELEEETGYAARELVELTTGPTAVGMSDETVTFFHARGLTRVGPGGGDDSEDITVHEVALTELESFLADGRRRGLAVDPKIYAGLYLTGVAGAVR